TAGWPARRLRVRARLRAGVRPEKIERRLALLRWRGVICDRCARTMATPVALRPIAFRPPAVVMRPTVANAAADKLEIDPRNADSWHYSRFHLESSKFQVDLIYFYHKDTEERREAWGVGREVLRITSYVPRS